MKVSKNTKIQKTTSRRIPWQINWTIYQSRPDIDEKLTPVVGQKCVETTGINNAGSINSA